MEAQIFFMEHQRQLLPEIRKSLHTHISPSLEIREEYFDAGTYGEATYVIGRQYIALLQAAIDPREGMGMSLGTLEGFRYRFYFQVYYDFVSWKVRNFWDQDLFPFFPAVALRNQMVLVPHNLGTRLGDAGERGSPLKALHSGGVQEVDFQNPGGLDLALKEVYSNLRTSFFRELQAYASYQEENELTPLRVAEDLKMDLGFVRQVLKGDSVAFERSPYKGLTCELDSVKLSPGRWTKLTLMVKNHSEEDVPALSIDIAGPIKTRPSRLQTGVMAGATADVQLAIMPEERGEFPIEVKLTLPEDKLLTQWLPLHHIWLEVD
jgi:hypothetical protein